MNDAEQETLRKLRVVVTMRPPEVSCEAIVAMLIAVAMMERDKCKDFNAQRAKLLTARYSGS